MPGLMRKVPRVQTQINSEYSLVEVSESAASEHKLWENTDCALHETDRQLELISHMGLS